MTAAPTPELTPVVPTSTDAGRGVFSAALNWLRKKPALMAQLRGFALVAVVCTAISMTLFALLRPSLGTQWANTISLVLCSVLNTDLNRRVSFGLHTRELWWRDQKRGVGVMLLALAMTTGSLWILHHLSPNASIGVELAVIVLGNIASAVTRFVLLRYWVFRRARHGVGTQKSAVANDDAPALL